MGIRGSSYLELTMNLEEIILQNGFYVKPMDFGQYISELFEPIKKVLLISELENSL